MGKGIWGWPRKSVDLTWLKTGDIEVVVAHGEIKNRVHSFIKQPLFQLGFEHYNQSLLLYSNFNFQICKLSFFTHTPPFHSYFFFLEMKYPCQIAFFFSLPMKWMNKQQTKVCFLRLEFLSEFLNSLAIF